VYTDDRVKDLIASRFVPVRIHVKENAAEWKTLSSDFGVLWTPTTLIVATDGEEKHRIEGFLPADDFLSQIELGLAHAAFNRGDYPASERLFRDVTGKYPDTDAAPEAVYWAGVSRFRATDDPAALKETNTEVSRRYPASSWAKKASVWQ
jgi:TolA-binding protein